MGRKSKRQAREENELEELQIPGLDHSLPRDEGPEEEQPDLRQQNDTASNSNAFAALNLGHQGENEDEEEQEDDTGLRPTSKKKSKKKKKKKPASTPVAALTEAESGVGVESSGTVTPTSQPQAGAEEGSGTLTKKKVRKKKTKGKSKETEKDIEDDLEAEEDDGLDEIERALKELDKKDRTKGGNDAPSDPGEDHRSRQSMRLIHKLKSLLSVDMKNLDSDLELKRMFGSKVVSSVSQQQQQSSPYHRLISSNPHHRLAHSSRGTYLAKPEPTWPPYHMVKTGLEMEELWKSRETGEVWYSFVHTRGYRAATLEMLNAVTTMDPNLMMNLVRDQSPYHCETLLQLSEVWAQQGDHGLSASLINRALHSFERGSLPAFNLANGNSRLDFKRIENRTFYRAVEKKVNVLCKRGTWITAWQWARLLLALDPYDDPMGSLFFLDFLSVKARQFRWLLDLIETLSPSIDSGFAEALPSPDDPQESGTTLDHLFVGMCYAAALAKWGIEEDEKSEDHTESDEALRKAILRFPFVLPLLYDKLGQSLPKKIYDHPRAFLAHSPTFDPIYPFHVMTHLYVHRSESLWKEPSTLAWLQRVVNKIANEEALSDSSNPHVQFGEDAIAGNTALKPVVINDSLKRHMIVQELPLNLRTLLPPEESVAQFTYDPLPPPNSTKFDNEYLRPVMSRELRGMSRASLRERTQELIRQGVAGATQEELMEILAQAQAGGGGLPGQFPPEGIDGQDPNQDQLWDEDEDGEPQDPNTLMRQIGAMFRMFRGDQAPVAEGNRDGGT